MQTWKANEKKNAKSYLKTLKIHSFIVFFVILLHVLFQWRSNIIIWSSFLGTTSVSNTISDPCLFTNNDVQFTLAGWYIGTVAFTVIICFTALLSVVTIALLAHLLIFHIIISKYRNYLFLSTLLICISAFVFFTLQTIISEFLESLKVIIYKVANIWVYFDKVDNSSVYNVILFRG